MCVCVCSYKNVRVVEYTYLRVCRITAKIFTANLYSSAITVLNETSKRILQIVKYNLSHIRWTQHKIFLPLILIKILQDNSMNLEVRYITEYDFFCKCWLFYIYSEYFQYPGIADIRIKGHVELTIKRATISLKVCSFPLCGQKLDLHTVPLKTRKETLKHKRFYMPRLVKACPQHINHEAWMSIDCFDGENMFTVEQIEDMVDMLRLELKPGEHALTGTVHFGF